MEYLVYYDFSLASNVSTKWTISFVFHEELVVKRITCLCWRNGEIHRNGPAMYFSRLIEVGINTSFHWACALKVLRMPKQSFLSGENVSHLKYKYIALLQCESYPLSFFSTEQLYNVFVRFKIIFRIENTV